MTDTQRPGRAIRALVALLPIAAALAAGDAAAQSFSCWDPGATFVAGSSCGITWPGEGGRPAWLVYSDAAEQTGPGDSTALPQFDFVSSPSQPGVYWQRFDNRLFFRIRVAFAGAVTAGTYLAGSATGGAIWIYLNTTGTAWPAADPPEWALVWDSHYPHGLEMLRYQRDTTWDRLLLDDFDGSVPNKLARDVNYNYPTASPEAWLRTVDSFGQSSTFLDVAVSCSYFGRVRAFDQSLPDLCNVPFQIQVGSHAGANDHAFIGSSTDGDVGMGIAADLGVTIAQDPSAPGYGAGISPTAARVANVRATPSRRGVSVSWETSSETRTAGFRLHRVDPATGDRVPAGGFVPALLGATGGTYAVVDPGAAPAGANTYVVEEVEFDGGVRMHGPFVAARGEVGPPPDGLEPAEGTTRRVRASASRAYDAPRSPRRAGRSGPGAQVKIGVREPGLVRLGAASIGDALGLPAGAVRALARAGRLAVTGPEGHVPVLVEPGGGAVAFHATGAESIYTDVGVYWMGRGEALAMATVAAGRPGATPRSTFDERLHVERDLLPVPSLFHDPEGDFHVWDYLVAGSPALSSRSFPLTSAGATGGGARLTVRLHGLTTSGAGRDHRVAVALNGVPLGEALFTGTGPRAQPFEVDPGVLRDGDNVVELRALLDAGVPYSVVALEALDLEYPRAFRAVDDRLRFGAKRGDSIRVDGFTGPDVQVLDLADPRAPRLVVGAVTGTRAGASWVTFRAPRDGTYLAIARAASTAPAFVAGARPSPLRSDRRGADYVVITAPQLRGAAERLAAHRRARGLETLVTTTDELQDAFSGGMATPYALREFIRYALERWPRPPRFVVLAGEGSVDYRDGAGHGDALVPTLLVDTAHGLAPSDARLADADGDGVPDVALGRIPALDEPELDAYVAKLAAAEGDAGGWRSRALLLADAPDGGGDFAADGDALAAALSGAVETERITLSSAPLAVAREQLSAALGQGAALVNYFGHAAVDRLAREGLLSAADAAALANGPRLPIVSAMTCDAGNFGVSGFDGVGEALVQNPRGGAVAVWSPTSMVSHADSRDLAAVFVPCVLTPGRTAGECATEALRALARSGVSRSTLWSWALLGDPAAEARR